MTRRLTFLLIASVTASLSSFGQLCPPNIVSQQERPQFNFGSFAAFRLTSDGGYVLGGYSYSFPIAEKMSPNYGSADFSLIRLDANLEKLWDRSYGGTNGDYLYIVEQMADGGFLLGGESWSGASGNKTSTNYGSTDFWIVRTDGDGIPLWDKSFGGTNYDTIFDLQKLPDGGFVAGGYSSSPASGNKTSPNYGGVDCWVVRGDASGNKLWDRSFGGSGHDRVTSIAPTADGGFLIGGVSDSYNDGTKLEGSYGQFDYWIIRLDADGNELWQHTYGGDSTDYLVKVRQGSDGGFILAGSSFSYPSGSKTSPRRGYQDYWIVGVDANGIQIWEQSVGNDNSSEVKSAAATPDGGWIVAGTSLYPGTGGNKTSPNYGRSDYWLVRFDSAGSILWDQSYGGKYSEYLFNLEPRLAGGFVLIGQTDSRVGGNKTTPLQSPNDLWIVQLGVETPGDCDGDGIPDGNDLCPATPAGTLVNSNGCSITQLCPCNGGWTNHEEYVQCVSRVSGDLVQAGLMTDAQRSNTIAQASTDNCPYIPAPIIAFGLTNYPIRQAFVGFGEESGSSLFVSELGFEGLDGLSMHLGQADSGLFIYPHAPMQYNYNEAWFMTATAYGSVNGVTNSVISRMRGTKPYYETYPVEVDFSWLGATSVTYQVFAGKSLVTEATEAGAIGRLTINSASYLGPRANPFWRAPDGSVGALIDFDTTGELYRFSITGPFYGVEGNHIFIRANNPTGVVDFVSRVDVLEGGGLESFSVLNARLGMFHRAHQALGPAIFTAGGGKLQVASGTNFQWTTEEFAEFSGTLIEANESARFDVQLEPLKLETNGSVFEAYVAIETNGVEGAWLFGSVGMTNVSGALHLRADFSQPEYGSTNVVPHVVVLKVYNKGAYVGSMNQSGMPVVITAGASVPALVASGAQAGTSNAPPYFAFTLDQQATFSVGTAVLQGNHFRVIPSDVEAGSEAVSSLTLGVRNFPAFTIIGEQADSGPPALSIAVSEGTVTLSWPNENQPFILESSPELGDEFTPVSGNVAFSANRNLVTVPLETTGNRFFRLRLAEE